jgi:type VII secretion-associated protein (TIGR03931 family)
VAAAAVAASTRAASVPYAAAASGVEAAVLLDESRMWLRVGEFAEWSAVPALARAPDGTMGRPGVGVAEPSIPRFLDGDRLALGGVAVPVDAALRALVRDLLDAAGWPPPHAKLTVACPLHWGPPRRAAVRAALAELATEVDVVPAASRPAVARAARRGSVSGRSRCLVVECAPLSTTAGYVVYDGNGSRVEGCEHEPTLALSDPVVPGPEPMAELLARAARDRQVDAVIVLGDPPQREVEIVARAVRAALSATVEIRPVSGGHIVRADGAALDRHASRPDPVTSDDSTALGSNNATPQCFPRSARRALPVLGAVLLVLAAAVLTWLRYGRSDAPRPEADQVITIGRVTVSVPAGWRIRPAIAGESPDVLRLVPRSGPRRRIEVSQTTSRGNPTIDDVAADLQAQIALRARPDKYSPAQEEVVAGRQVITYQEVEEGNSEVKHHVIVMHGAQVSVDCQYLTGEWDAIAGACEHTVGSAEVGP